MTSAALYDTYHGVSITNTNTLHDIGSTIWLLHTMVWVSQTLTPCHDIGSTIWLLLTMVWVSQTLTHCHDVGSTIWLLLTMVWVSQTLTPYHDIVSIIWLLHNLYHSQRSKHVWVTLAALYDSYITYTTNREVNMFEWYYQHYMTRT